MPIYLEGAETVLADWNVGEGRSEHISVIILECFFLTR